MVRLDRSCRIVEISADRSWLDSPPAICPFWCRGVDVAVVGDRSDRLHSRLVREKDSFFQSSGARVVSDCAAWVMLDVVQPVATRVVPVLRQCLNVSIERTSNIMFHPREIVTAIELGTSRFCVLVGEALPDGHVNIIGRGTASSAGSVIKGEIDNMEKAFEQLGIALDEAEQSSDRELGNSRLVVVTVTGCAIDSHQGVGTVFVKNDQHKVTEKERLEAHENAKIQHLAPDRVIINSSESYFMVDGRRVRNPLNHTATKLDAYVHVVHAQAVRLENFRSIIRDSGFEETMVEVVFSPLADDFGILSDEERENGVLLVDLGAGTTEFEVEYNSGVLASGVLQIGFEHVCNDLSIGLDLPISVCRKLFEDGILSRAIRDRQEFFEFGEKGGRKRKIPLSSFETIIDLRLREIFEIIRQNLSSKCAVGDLEAGGVLTGGGALFERSAAIFREVFDLSCRVGQPLEAGGAVTGVEDPRFSTVWGALKIAAYYNQFIGSNGNRSAVTRVIDVMDSLIDRTRRGFRNLKGSIKV